MQEPNQQKRTSQILAELMDSTSGQRKITVGDFVSGMSDRVFGIAIIIFALVNAFIPGVSVVFSIPVFTLAVQMLLGQHQVWIPRRFAKAGFKEEIVNKVIRKIIPTLHFLEKFIRPRMTALTANRGERFIALLIILLNLLVIPPIPGLNMVPSLCVCFLALALLENDGFLALISIIVSLLVLLFYYGVAALMLYGIIQGGAEFKPENMHHMFGKAVEQMNDNIPAVEVPGMDIDLNDQK